MLLASGKWFAVLAIAACAHLGGAVCSAEPVSIGRFDVAFDAVAVQLKVPLRARFDRCEPIGRMRMCHYRLADGITAIATAKNGVDVDILSVFVSREVLSKGGIRHWVEALGVASFLFSPTAAEDDRTRTLRKLGAFPASPSSPVDVKLDGTRYEAFIAPDLVGRVTTAP